MQELESVNPPPNQKADVEGNILYEYVISDPWLSRGTMVFPLFYESRSLDTVLPGDSCPFGVGHRVSSPKSDSMYCV